MSNHLHELLEDEANGATYIEETADISLDVDMEISNQTKRHSADAMCFYAGDFVEVSGLTSYPDLSRLPFDNCWIEFTSDVNGCRHLFCVLCWISEDGGYVGQVWLRNQHKWKFSFSYLSVDGKSYINGFGAKLEDKYFQAFIHTVNAFLSALNCTNINRIENKPSEKLQKARAKRGKKPLFSYWTLEIDLPKSRAAGEDYGGTHASPRLHLRRGHPRQYAMGKWCWVQPHVVGNKAAGMVHKDYAVNHAPQ